MLRCPPLLTALHADQRKKLLARNRGHVPCAIRRRFARLRRRRDCGRGLLRPFRSTHACKARGESGRLGGTDLWLGRQFPQRRHGPHRHEIAGTHTDQALRPRRRSQNVRRIACDHRLRRAHRARGKYRLQFLALRPPGSCLQAGACLYDHTRVTSVEPERNKNAHKFRVRTSRGVITAREVILASGAYTTGATPALRKKIIPIGSYIIATEALPGDLACELSPRNRMIYDSKHFLYYYRLTPDNRMLFGGRAAFFPETENTVRRSAEILRLGMIGVYPQLRDTKIEFVWGGTLDFTLDMMPHAGKIDGMYFAAGFAGHGVAAATWFGAKLAGLICGDPNDMPFDGIKFLAAPPGLRSGNAWALPLAGAWYKILDFF